MTHPATQSIVFEDLGRVDYDAAFDVQRAVHAEVLAGVRPPTVLLLEHDPPVVTVSRRKGAGDHLLAPPAVLDRYGIQVRETDRGGDITYHGPGQLVAYPILRLDGFDLNLRRYIRLLEQAVIDTAAAFDVAAGRDTCAVGVWVGESAASCAAQAGDGAARSAKLAAIGVRIRKWTTMHGLALNVTTNLDHFGLIVPCGLQRPVTSLQQLLGDRCPSMDAVKRTLADALRALLATGGR
ncbi:MAG: lipoyl(octanoyl) transferase LipB [Phycisphaera sp.]|nr:lipoyl(octanoyl) transferase LipB [Phycisphaera sp.]